jgi:hypothetical protein
VYFICDCRSFCGYKYPTGKVGMLCANKIVLCGSVRGCNSVVDMDFQAVELVNSEKERNSLDLNSVNQVRNKTLRRAQVLKDKRQKTKVCVTELT